MNFNIKKVYLFIITFLLLATLTGGKYAWATQNDLKIVQSNVDHYPLLEGDNKSFSITSRGEYKVQYRVFLLNSKGNTIKELTNGYSNLVNASDLYEVKLKENFLAGDYKLKVWARKENSTKDYDYEKITSMRAVKNENNVLKISGEMNVVGDTFRVNEQINIKGINDIQGKKAPYKYKLHIYDVKEDKWIIDNSPYRDDIKWIPEHEGTYILDLWVVSKDSSNWNILNKNPQAKVYDGWKLKTITVDPIPKKVEVKFVVNDHYPVVEGGNEKFYITSKYADKVQYRVWLIRDGIPTDITNGYSYMTDADKPFEISLEDRLKEGNYKLWILVREEGSLKSYDSYYEYKFTCIKDNNDNLKLDGPMNISNGPYHVNENIVVNGIKDISGIGGEYKYKLHILNVKTGEWIVDDKDYRDTVQWTPDKPGIYMLDLWTISTKSKKWDTLQKNPNSRLFDAWKLQPIIVEQAINQEDTSSGEDKETENGDNTNSNNDGSVPDEGDNTSNEENNQYYTNVNNLSELYVAIEKGYRPVINDEKAKEIYEKAKEIISTIITDDMSEFQKELAIHDYIVKNTDYDYINYLNDTVPVDSYTAYGLLINKTAVCQGYAEAMNMLLNMVGIESKTVVGETYEDHAWNLVKIDGQYYHVDPTWDDPLSTDDGKVSYAYFNLSDEKMAKDHTWNFSKYPQAVSDKYAYLHPMYHPIISDGYIYYSDEMDGRKLYKIRLDGSNRAKLANASSKYEYTTADDEWVYYSNYSHGGYLYKTRKDGIGNTMLNDEWSKDIYTDKDWIYYTGVLDGKLYKIRKDGTDKQAIEESKDSTQDSEEGIDNNNPEESVDNNKEIEENTDNNEVTEEVKDNN